MRKNLLIFLLLCLLTMGAQAQLKPRVVILTDIGQPDLEPDDTESLVHLLSYESGKGNCQQCHLFDS